MVITMMEHILFISGMEGRFSINMKIKDILPYFRFYSDEPESDETINWFCRIDNKFYSYKDLINLYNYTTEEQIVESGIFVKLSKVDIILEKKRFLEDRYPNVLKKIQRRSCESFDIEFNRFLDHNNKYNEWYEYEQELLNTKFNNWRKDNCIILGLQ